MTTIIVRRTCYIKFLDNIGPYTAGTKILFNGKLPDALEDIHKRCKYWALIRYGYIVIDTKDHIDAEKFDKVTSVEDPVSLFEDKTLSEKVEDDVTIKEIVESFESTQLVSEEDFLGLPDPSIPEEDFFVLNVTSSDSSENVKENLNLADYIPASFAAKFATVGILTVGQLAALSVEEIVALELKQIGKKRAIEFREIVTNLLNS